MAAKSPNGPVGVLSPKIFGIPIDRKILFTNHKNVYKKNIEKRQRKLIVKIPFVKSFLKSDEKVLLVTTGYSPLTSFEKYIIGWLFLYMKRSLFIFTNMRVLHVPTTAIYSFRHIISQIPYENCKSLSVKGRTLVVEYTKLGKIERFIGIAGSEKRRLNALLKTMRFGTRKEGNVLRKNLCPRCITVLSGKKFYCEKCKLKFKTKIGAVLFSIFAPGGGYFYIYQYVLGGVIGLVELILIVMASIAAMDVSRGVSSGIIWVLISVLTLLGIKAFTIIHVLNFIDEMIPLRRYLKK